MLTLRKSEVTRTLPALVSLCPLLLARHGAGAPRTRTATGMELGPGPGPGPWVPRPDSLVEGEDRPCLPQPFTHRRDPLRVPSPRGEALAPGGD